MPPAISVALEHVPAPMALVDLGSRTFVATNRPFDALFGSPKEPFVGRTVEAIMPAGSDDEHVAALSALASNRLEGYQRMATYLAADGSEFQAEVWVRRLHLGDAPAGLAVAVLVPGERAAGDASLWDGFVAGAGGLAFVVTDHEWRVEHASRDIETFLGYDPPAFIGTPLLGLIHPQDAANFLLAAEHAVSSGQTMAARARIKAANGSWQDLVCFVAALCDHSPPRLGIVFALPGTNDATSDTARARELEQRLWRIAMEVRAAGLVRAVRSTVPADRAREFSELSGRQWEIVTRLVGGQSVPEIAGAMYLRQNTVRNHLTAVFRKFGVHSQRELLSLLTSAARPPG